MPPKKDKKKKKPTKRRAAKKVTLAPPLPRLPTGFNREIPGGIIGTGGGGGGGGVFVPPSYAMASGFRAPPPATPIQTPDQFQIQRQLASQARVIEGIESQQRVANLDRINSLRQAGLEPVLDESGNIRKVTIKRPKKSTEEIVMPEPTAPPVISSASYPGGAPARQQGMNLAMPGRLRGVATDPSTSLVGLEPIGDADVTVLPQSELQVQAVEGGEF